MQFNRGSLLLIGIALAIPLHAVDGVVLINQNAALAGAVTPGDAPGFPVTISVPGSYKLSGNLTVPDANTTAIAITVDGVTIDLNGFAIIGPTVCSGVPAVTSCSPTGTGEGIQSVNSDITVLNGRIQGMGSRGVHLSGDHLRVEKIRAISNGGDGIFARSAAGNSEVIACIASNNGFSGILVNGVATGNTASGNLHEGIVFEGAGFNNVARTNRGVGIIGSGTFNGNFSKDNGLQGIFAVCPSTVVANTAVGNSLGDIDPNGSGCTRANNAPAP
jgi:hypothetical protein